MGSTMAKIKLKPKINIDPEARKIVFKHDRCIGDALMFTAGIRDFKLLFPDIVVGVESNQHFLWENNPYIEPGLNKNQKGVEFYEVGYPAVGNSSNGTLHFTNMFLFDMIAVADLHTPLPLSLGEFCASFANGSVGDPPLGNPRKNKDAREPFISLREKYKKHCKEFSRQWGDIHMSSEEKENNLIEREFGVKEYWVITPGGKWDFTAKQWDWRQMQHVIDHFEGKIKFVVVGKSEGLQWKLDNVIDLLDYFNDDIRGLIPLVYHSTGAVCVPSFLMHLTAAVPSKFAKERKPCVSIFGGREPVTWSWYCNHQILHTNGAHSCCMAGGCFRARTEYVSPEIDRKGEKHNKSLCYRSREVDGRKVQACMSTITAEDVIRAIERYYEGDMYRYEDGTRGRLVLRHLDKKKKEPEVKEDAHEVLNDLDDDELQEIKDEEQIQWTDEEMKIVHEEAAKMAEEEIGPLDIKLPDDELISVPHKKEKKINLLGNLNTDGGGEQSLLMIARLLEEAGWDVHLYPWGSVSDKLGLNTELVSFSDNNFPLDLFDNVPLLFYANDKSWTFAKDEKAKQLVNKCSALVVGINYVIGGLQRAKWLDDTRKLKAVIFQNREKAAEWERERQGFDYTRQITLYGAIDLEQYLAVEPLKREKGSDLVVLKHCKADKRKFVTTESTGGDKLHVWQKNLAKDLDTKLYQRLLKDVKQARFEFMEAPAELVNFFDGEPRMVFHKWNAMPVSQFLSRGHVFLYRTSNRWRDQYPRVMAEALGTGLPVLTEPRDGTADRVVHGDTGFYCVDYDGFKYALKLLERKEDYRQAMAEHAKQWAKENLNPQRWVTLLEEILL